MAKAPTVAPRKAKAAAQQRMAGVQRDEKEEGEYEELPWRQWTDANKWEFTEKPLVLRAPLEVAPALPTKKGKPKRPKADERRFLVSEFPYSTKGTSNDVTALYLRLKKGAYDETHIILNKTTQQQRGLTKAIPVPPPIPVECAVLVSSLMKQIGSLSSDCHRLAKCVVEKHYGVTTREIVFSDTDGCDNVGQAMHVGETRLGDTPSGLADASILGIRPFFSTPRATEHVDEMVRWIERLEEKGLAYRADDGSVYFRISAFEGYGRL